MRPRLTDCPIVRVGRTLYDPFARVYCVLLRLIRLFRLLHHKCATPNFLLIPVWLQLQLQALLPTYVLFIQLYSRLVVYSTSHLDHRSMQIVPVVFALL